MAVMPASGPLRIAVVSLGCPKALIDSEKMLALLAEAGCLVGAPTDQADVILINTCAFIPPAREEAMEAIREALEKKRQGRVRRVVVTGCLPQREGGKLLSAVPEVDAIVGLFHRDEIVSAVTSRQSPFIRVGRIGRKDCPDDRGRLRLTPRHTAYLRIAEGCSTGCSFCSIPGIRGPLRSKPMDIVLDEAAELIADGAIELVLIAQNTTAYGSDFDDGTNLETLLRRLDALPGLRWLRLMYANAGRLTEPIIDAIAECPRIVNYLDLPLQHISDKILKLMRRRYDRVRAESLLATLRRRVPGISLRTTFLVGFPQESPGQFQELLEFVRAARFEAMGVFTYWPEPGTTAAGLRGQVSRQVKTRRRELLMQAQQEIAFAANAARVGSKVAVLVDGIDPAGRCVGRHAGQAPEVDSLCILRPAGAGVDRPASGAAAPPVGRIVEGKVVDFDDYDLIVKVDAGAADVVNG